MLHSSVTKSALVFFFFMSSGSVVYHVLEYFKGCYTRQSNSPCIVTLPSSALIGATLPTTNLLRVHHPPPVLFQSFYIWNCCAYYCVQKYRA